MSTFRTAEQFQARLDQLQLSLPFDSGLESGDDSVLSRSLMSTCGTIGNRWCILPMEGWDGTTDGRPSDLTRRRWRNFGLSGVKLIWGGEAVAVRPDGRANPNQLLINEETLGDITGLRELLEAAHRDQFGRTDDLLTDFS